MMWQLDHLAIAAETLAEGAAWVERTLDVSLQPGGQHPLMGTHNRLLGLADGLYLEVIATNPDAPVPARPRWFDLDRFSGPPRLQSWILRGDDLAAAPAQAGKALALERGDLRWQMAVPADGRLPFDGLYPALIAWEGAAHPADRLAPSGCRLLTLEVSHPDVAQLAAQMPPMEDPRVRLVRGAPRLRAEIETPSGTKVLQ